MEIDNKALFERVQSFDGISVLSREFTDSPFTAFYPDHLDEIEIHISGHGIGDAMRIAAAQKLRMDPTKKQIVLVEDTPRTGMIAIANFSFVDYVIGIPSEYWRFSPSPNRCLWLLETVGLEQHDYLFSLLLGTSTKGEIRLLPEDLRTREYSVELPEKYAAIQPTTTLFKGWSLDFTEVNKLIRENLNLPIILMGSKEDKDLVPDIEADLDLRGVVGLEESIWITITADFVAAIESWSTNASATFGIKSLVFCSPETMDIHKLRWSEYWKTCLSMVLFHWSENKVHNNIDSKQLNQYFDGINQGFSGK